MILASSSGEAGRAWRTAIVLAAILAALVFWDHRLDRRDRALRERSLRIGRVIADVDPQGLTVRELRITLGSAPSLVYSPRLDGLWRCLTAQAAPVRVTEMELVVRSTLGASGVVRSADPDAAPRYGIGIGQTIRLSLHGRGALEVPGSDLLFEVEIGDCIPDADTCFVRRAGSPEIWAVEGNLRQLLLPSQDGGLPLIDPNVIPRVWPGARELPLRVRIERAGDEPFELERQDSGGEAAQPGEPATSW
ncbi:MAG TPA: hypothetical protein VMS86_05180, partial [Thermoanaerobaculia bacterium]|nr:hypothetical protein [Thermoanaerobaculia bacterium]